jgi:hypothetical protein
MLDLGALHNLIPKAIMDKLGLGITRQYNDLYSFYSRKIQCLGMIKDLVANLTQIPSKRFMMDVVVVDVPVSYEILQLHTITFLKTCLMQEM